MPHLDATLEVQLLADLLILDLSYENRSTAEMVSGMETPIQNVP